MVYKFSFAGCNACYVGETTRHFSTRARELMATPSICSKKEPLIKLSNAELRDLFSVATAQTHFSTRVLEHLSADRASHVYKHLQQSESCHNLCSANCFSILDCATTSVQLKVKESLDIHWEKPTLNQQEKPVNLKLNV